jgi:hypothetical protein
MTVLRDMDSSQYLKHIQDISSLPDFQGRYTFTDFSGIENRDLGELGIYANDEKLYFAACYNFRKTLTKLHLVHDCNHSHTLDGQTNASLFFLSYFKHLTRLTFHNTYDNDLTTFDIQRICSNLVHLKFNSSVPFPDHRINTVLQNIDEQIKIYNKDMDTVLDYNTKLKELTSSTSLPIYQLN